MKKLILAGLLAVTATFGASATVIEFNDTSFDTDLVNPSEVSFDGIDLTPSVGTIVQTGANFVETGTLGVTNFMNGLLPVFAGGFPFVEGYELFIDFELFGTAGINAGNPAQIDVLFNGGSAELFADTTSSAPESLGTLSFGSGDCTSYLNGATGRCDIRMEFTPVLGYFEWDGVDLLTHQVAGAGIWFDFVMTVQGITGFNAAGVPFEVIHDGNVFVSVPEPTSLAILGLGLLGFAGVRRRKS